MRKPATGASSQPFDLWGQRGWPHQEVVGESNYVKEIVSLFGGKLSEDGAELTLTAQLIPEPTNRLNRNVVMVQIDGRKVGYLPREDAARYAAVLSEIVGRGLTPQVTARVWGGRGYEDDELIGSVRLDLAEPHLLMPVNPPPTEPYAVMPYGNAIQVTGEETYMAALVPLLSSAGESWVHATLHEVVEEKARSTRTLAEVHIEGAVVGRLTPKMSAELLPVVRHLDALGALTVCRTILKGNSLKADVVLYPARANQLSQEWLDAPPIHGTSARVIPPGEPAVVASTPAGPPAPSGYGTTAAIGWRFHAPPGWPPPPSGWTPPPGWRPDPVWPPAPPGWQFWIADPSPRPATSTHQ